MTTELEYMAQVFGWERQKFNPNHDPETGEFSEGGSSGVIVLQNHVIDTVMSNNPPEQIRTGKMTREEWVKQYVSPSDKEYKLMAVHPKVLTTPTPAGDSTFVAKLAKSDKRFNPIVVDSNESIQARFGGGKLDRAFGYQDTTVLDGKHRLAAALARGDNKIMAYVPSQHVARLASQSARAEQHDFAIKYFTDKGYKVNSDAIGNYSVTTRDGKQKQYGMRDIIRIAQNQGHKFSFPID